MSKATSKTAYFEKIDQILAEQDGCIDAELIFSRFEQRKETVKKYLKEYLDKKPEIIRRIVGFYPSSETVISLAEKEIGNISGNNVSAINLHCKCTIDSITKPKHWKFLSEFLDTYISEDKSYLRVSKSDLVDFLYEEYVDFVHESDNGLVSIAGGMNEKILLKGLVNSGLVIDENVRKTGTNSEGDIQVEYRGRTTKILYCEVKSYAARERLLRGLRDIPHPDKIGVGFFTNAAEFNPARTHTLLEAGPLAIYMPDVTYNNLHADSKSQTTNRQDKLYRPLSVFFTDMVGFKDNGNLPSFK